MKTELIAKNYRVNNNIGEIIDKKFAKLDKYFDEDAKCKIYLKQENRSSKMEVEVNYKGTMIRAQAYADNFYDAVDLVIPKIEKQIYKHRSKLEKKLKQNALADKLFNEEELKPAKLVKTKQFALTAMSVDEALEEFELLGHNFYVFLDEESNSVKVLYLRDDGNVGLIEPVI